MTTTQQDQYLEQFTALAHKAAELWMKLIYPPEYDNGDKTATGGLTSIMAAMMPNNASDDNIKLFGENVVKLLLEKWPDRKEDGWYSLDSDYDPCELLSTAANEADLKIKFPWKINLDIIPRYNYVSVSAGYGAPYVYHYPLENGKCLVTTIRGEEEDMNKIKDYIINGTPLEFKVE